MEAVIFVGIPASGKSTFYRARFAATHVRLNLDTLKSRQREQSLLAAAVSEGQSFVVDNTNTTRAGRARYIGPARAAGYRIIGYYFEARLSDCLARNRGRPPAEVVPDKGIVAMYYRLQPPAWDEGFDELYTVTIEPEGGFLVRPWTFPGG